MTVLACLLQAQASDIDGGSIGQLVQELLACVLRWAEERGELLARRPARDQLLCIEASFPAAPQCRAPGQVLDMCAWLDAGGS